MIKFYYETTRNIYESIIAVKKDLGNMIPAEISAKNLTIYIKAAIVKA